MTEPNKGGRKPVPDHLKRKRRIYFLNEAENEAVDTFVQALRGDSESLRRAIELLTKEGDR